MKITFFCGHCCTELGVPESASGKAARCPTCQAVVEVPPVPSRPKAVPIRPSTVEPASDDDAIDAEPVRPRYDLRVAARHGVAKTEPAQVEEPASRDAAPAGQDVRVRLPELRAVDERHHRRDRR